MNKCNRDIILSNLDRIKEGIIHSCQRVGRNPSEINILPVTKTRSLEEVSCLRDIGYREFGENLVKEGVRKYTTSENGIWIMIGHLQTNKVKDVVRFAKEVHSVDSIKLINALEKELQRSNKIMRGMLQVNTSGETSKYGFSEAELFDNLDEISKLEYLKIDGVMTLALNSKNEADVRKCFEKLKSIQTKINNMNVLENEVTRISMGMSGDYKIAIEEGATDLRLGQAIFGPRETPDSFYWPA
ncbi:YggS family pyridoxal phosphate-dependent enzyme [Bacteriovorax sp. Seq25_V]|uniref:YggS family pyridoxal phosphate-dependent enzyme n=1 Tax=Bacteriovorax sp. Seq25_V TaxID=1201288 RepID=UPI000389EBF4|nr:YggS family pyridoxal phosphate-dependent enzyme [Bacteriovorax sp. Seq25_V]EQC45640.1 pyridoxal phosphate enzyme, YggS family [Bacteriovorax sp. Seq25_V]